MTVIIEIYPTDDKIDYRNIRTKDGREMQFREQTAYVHLGDRFPVRTTLSIDEGQPPYAVGQYTFHAAAFEIDSYGRIALKRRPLLVALETHKEKGVK